MSFQSDRNYRTGVNQAYICVFFLTNFVIIDFIVFPKRLLLSSQNSGHMLPLTPAQFLHTISV